MIGPQCEEINEEEFVRGKRSLLELLDDAMPLSEDLAEIIASWKEVSDNKSSIYTKYGHFVEGKTPSTKILGVPENEDTSHDYD